MTAARLAVVGELLQLSGESRYTSTPLRERIETELRSCALWFGVRRVCFPSSVTPCSPSLLARRRAARSERDLRGATPGATSERLEDVERADILSRCRR